MFLSDKDIETIIMATRSLAQSNDDLRGRVAELEPYKAELISLAQQIGDDKDPFAVWETMNLMARTIETLNKDNETLKKNLEDEEGLSAIIQKRFNILLAEKDALAARLEAVNAETMPPIPPIEAYEEPNASP